jgi:6-phosphogluconolactonase
MACYCSIDSAGKNLLTSSYMSGSVTVTPIMEDGSLGINSQVIRQPVRQGFHWPSVHSVYETADGRYILSTNVGLDRVFLHRREGDSWAEVFEIEIPGRPRQAAFSRDGKFIYVSTEFSGEVNVLAYDPESPAPLTLIQRISTTRPGWSGHAETAGIKLSPDGRMLLVANRAQELNNLAIFSADPVTGLLEFCGHAPVHGVFPRDFDFTPDGRYVLAGLQFSDNLEIFQVNHDRTLTSRGHDFKLPCCSCVKFLTGEDVKK